MLGISGDLTNAQDAVCNGLDCAPPQRYVQVLIGVTANVTLFGNRVYADVTG